MQWTIKLEFTPDGGEPIGREIGSITRPFADLKPEEIGLTLACYCTENAPSTRGILGRNDQDGGNQLGRVLDSSGAAPF
jgi:hypothetical protein